MPSSSRVCGSASASGENWVCNETSYARVHAAEIQHAAWIEARLDASGQSQLEVGRRLEHRRPRAQRVARAHQCGVSAGRCQRPAEFCGRGFGRVSRDPDAAAAPIVAAGERGLPEAGHKGGGLRRRDADLPNGALAWLGDEPGVPDRAPKPGGLFAFELADRAELRQQRREAASAIIDGTPGSLRSGATYARRRRPCPVEARPLR